MDVVLATRAFAPEPAAAAWRHAALASALVASGHRVRVLTSRLPAVVAGAAETTQAAVSRWPVLRDASGNVRGYLQYASFDVPLALRLLLGRRPDVIVVEPPPTTGVVVRVVAALRRVPYVYYAADLLSYAAAEAGLRGPALALLRAVESWVLRGAATVLTVSDGYAERLQALGVPPERIVQVGTGVNTDVLRPPAHPVDDEPPTLVYAGTMSEVQGVGVLVEALGRVLPEHPGARAVFYGGGVEAEALRRRAEELAPGAITFPGLVPLEEVAAATGRARAGLASQRPDSAYAFAFLVKPLASTACGTPVVYAGAGPMADLVRSEHLGWAVGWDVEEVAAAVREALDRVPGAQERQRLAAWTDAHHSLRAVAGRAADAVAAAGAARRRGAAR